MHQNINEQDRNMIDTDVSYILIDVTTGHGVVPIPGATVTISKHIGDDNYLFLGIFLTDENGTTQEILIPAPPERLAEDPMNPRQAFDIYFATVNHPEFYIEENLMIQVFGRSTSFLQVNMIPLPNHEEQDVTNQ